MDEEFNWWETIILACIALPLYVLGLIQHFREAMMRPTLEDQIRLSKMSREELIDLLMPHGLHQHINFWLHNNCLLIWRIKNWNWFNIWTGESGFRKFMRHGFKEWEEPNIKGGNDEPRS